MIKQKDIVLIQFPFSNFSSGKVRPALVISNNEYNKICNDIVVCAVTTQISDVEYKIIIDNKDLTNGYLPRKSCIRIDKPYSVLKNKVKKTQAHLSDLKYSEFVKANNRFIK